MNAVQLKQSLNDAYRPLLVSLYGEEAVGGQLVRYEKAIDSFLTLYGERENLFLFSAPGRTEIGGNHTDHQRGRVLAASVNLDVIAVVSPEEGNVIRVKSEGHSENVVSLEQLLPSEGEKNSSNSLIRGIAACFHELGFKIGGFTAYTTSNVLSGSGLSSSAAFEVLVGTILSGLYNDGKVDPVEIAKIGQYAENRYFGKPCGLMDQTASSVGGLVTIDFEDPAAPVVEGLSYDFAEKGYALCVVNTGGSHADLTDEYAAIPGEMRAVAAHFGKEVLRELKKEDLLSDIASLRSLPGGDRGVLRALHFFDENDRVPLQAAALKEDRLDDFFALVKASGESSYCLLQNVVSNKSTKEQGIALALALSDELLGGEGLCRVHGGGFAGTIQAYVPLGKVEAYRKGIEAFFGAGSCYVLRIRPVGGVKFE